ncbi:MAG: hypothetical protein GF334_08815, partial [Candidatus Altiarchaeales archaeon]|nr:hypothetical protein [Candidatus Altiarchaeales archaeon]
MSNDDKTYQKLLSIRDSTDLTLKPCSRLKSTFIGFDGKEYPLQLRYYQVQGILHLLAMQRFLLGDDTGTGKCCKKSTLVKSSRGLRPIQDFYPEETKPDTFYSLSGESVWVGGQFLPVSGFYDGGKKPTLKIKTHNGYELEGTLVHPILVRREEGEKWVKLSEIQEGDYVCIDRGEYNFGEPLSLPKIEASPSETGHQLPQRMTPDLSRFLAYVVAEGSIFEGTIHISQSHEINPEI